MECPVAPGSIHGSQSHEPYSTVRQAMRAELMKDHPKGSLPPDGYVEWFDWAEAQHLHGGLRQKQCDCCKLWFFPQERAAHNTDSAPEPPLP
jgi:hypothetical protein